MYLCLLPHVSDIPLQTKDKDLHDMFGMAHPLHRRRVCLGIQKIKDKEEEVVRGNVVYTNCHFPQLFGRSETNSSLLAALPSRLREGFSLNLE